MSSVHLRSARVPATALLLVVLHATPSGAQTTASSDADGMRASVRVGLGGEGIDAEATVDTSLLAGFIRIRAGAGYGQRVNPNAIATQMRPRVLASVLFFGPALRRTSWRPYAGTGMAQFVRAERLEGGPPLLLIESAATSLVGGLELTRGRWVVAGEMEVDATENFDTRRTAVGNRWSFTPRVGLAIRRRL